MSEPENDKTEIKHKTLPPKMEILNKTKLNIEFKVWS